MALVKCAECNSLISNKATKCPYCGYSPKGDCINCKHFEQGMCESYGRCALTEKELVRREKSVCPAVIKRFTF